MATGVTRKYSDNFNDKHELLPILSEESFVPARGMPRLELPDRKSNAELLRANNSKFSQIFPDRPCEPSLLSERSVIFTENLHGLQALLPSYTGKIRLFYIDPPYATGMSFHSRANSHAYEDIFEFPAYLEFMRRRLIVLKELLADDGSVYIHIGHQMMAHLKVIADEVFGYDNFRNLIIRRKCSSKNSTSKSLPNIHDYILFYTKSKNYIWNAPGTIPTAEWLDKEYTKSDSKGRYKLVPIHAPGIRTGETGKEWRGMMPPPGKHWQLTPTKLDELDRDGDIHWSKTGNPRRKVYLTVNKQQNLTDYWHDFRDAHHQSIKVTGYPTEKNLEMIRTIIKSSSNPGDLVCDCFCGSGSTLEAAELEDRKWIGMDCSPEAIRATVQRLLKGRQPMGTHANDQTMPQSLLDLNESVDLRLLVPSDYAEMHKSSLGSLFLTK